MLGKPEIEYFYSPHSAFAYIGADLLQKIALRKGAQIIHRPFNLDRVVTAVSGSFFGNQTDRHQQYFFDRELERWAEHRNVPIIKHRPTYHDQDMTLPAKVLVAAQDNGYNVDLLSQRMFEAHWSDDADISDQIVLHTLIDKMGIDPVHLINKSSESHYQDIYERNTNEAVARSVFGSPTYFAAGDMFYGQDHLELLERAIGQPYKGEWPKH